MLLLAWPTLGYISSSYKYLELSTQKSNFDRPPVRMRADAARQLVIPMVHGHPARGDWRAPFPYPAVAAGVGGLAIGLLAVGRTRRRQSRIVLAAAANLCLGAVIVYRLPPMDSILVRLPPIESMTLPRFAVLLAWSFSLLTACAVQGAITGTRRSWLWSAAATSGVAILAIASSPWLLASMDLLLVALTVAAVAGARLLVDRPEWLAPMVAVELALYAIGINPVADPSDRLPRPPLVERLAALQAAEGGRVLGLGGVLPANMASRFGLFDLRAYDPVRPVPYVRMMMALGDRNPALGGGLRNAPPGLCGAWSVRFLVTPPAAPAVGWQAVWGGEGGAIWRNPQWLPEVRAVGRAVVADDAMGWRLMTAEDFDFQTGAVVPAPGIEAAATVARVIDAETGAAVVRAILRCDGPCLLVVARPWAPGWRATVDGAAARLVRANLAGMGAAVPAGEHEVVLEYNPWRL
jgi:hypothetical protein